MKCSIFRGNKSTTPYDSKPVNHFLDRIRNGDSKEQIKQIRVTTDKSTRDALKGKLPAVTFAGHFNARSMKELIKPSGYACLDFDGHSNVTQLKNDISNNQHTYSCWISPSGNGVKVLVKIPLVDNNQDYTDYIKKIYESYDLPEYGDTGTCDISRLCYESYDPDIFINLDSELFTDKIYRPTNYNLSTPTKIPITDGDTVADRLMVWFKKRWAGGNRNNNLHALARQFNAFGVDINICERYLLFYEQTGFKSDEILKLIKSAYRYTAEFNTEFFEDTKKVETINKLLVSGESKESVKAKFPEVESDEIESQANNIDVNEFWFYNSKGSINLAPFRFRCYLESKNIFKYYPNGDDHGFVFIKKNGNFIDLTIPEKIKDLVLEDLDNRMIYDAWDMMASRTQYFNPHFLSMISTANIDVSKDDKNTANIYYKNKAVKIKKDSFELINYDDLEGYVWENQVIQRDISLNEESEGEYKTFIWKVAGEDINRYYTLKSVIGYLLHSYNNESQNRCIIFNDEMIAETPNGGSGKGLFLSAIGHIKKVSTINGKSFDSRQNFAYQTVELDTQVLLFDDVKKGFVFEDLFSIITEGLTIEKKGKDAIKIPFSDSPKPAITTNYTIKGEGNSFYRRVFEIEMSTYFGKQRTPEDEFGHLLFTDWDAEEWQRFDNFMLRCVQYYLHNGLVKSDTVNLELRKLINATSKEFVDFMDGMEFKGERYYKTDLKDKFTADYTDFNNQKWFTSNLFNKWVVNWCEYTGTPIEKGKTNGQRWTSINTPF